MLLYAVLLGAFTVAGCEESVAPVLGTERAFTVYGFFNARSDTQAMRVFSIDASLALTRPEPLDARVISANRQEGTEQAWQDSIVQYADGRFGHVFWSEFRAGFERDYRLEVTRSDGATTSVEVTVPPLSEPVLLDPTVAERFVFLPVLWAQAPRLNNIRVRYYTRCDTTRGIFEFDYPEEQEQMGEGTVLTVRFSNDARSIFEQIVQSPCQFRDLRLDSLQVLALVTNAEWVPPTGVYDPELLVEPGTFSNVDNGFGFVGAGYPSVFGWEPPDSVLTAAGFVVGEDDEEGD